MKYVHSVLTFLPVLMQSAEWSQSLTQSWMRFSTCSHFLPQIFFYMGTEIYNVPYHLSTAIPISEKIHCSIWVRFYQSLLSRLVQKELNAHTHTHTHTHEPQLLLWLDVEVHWCFSCGWERAGCPVTVQRPQERGTTAGAAQLPGLPAAGAGQPLLRRSAVSHWALPSDHGQLHLLRLQEVRELWLFYVF